MASKLSIESAQTDRVAQVLEWCIQNSFEYVEIDLTDPVHGWSHREKDGVPRVMEALTSHMWANMVRTTGLAYSFIVLICILLSYWY